jgi:ribosomal-protein-alanine N-acetyltransferase
VSLTLAGPAHAAALAAIHAESFPPPERWDAAAFATLLAQPGVFALIDPDGGLAMLRVVAGEAEILTLGVGPELRRQGRARALLMAAAAHAAASGAEILFLEVSVTNDAARALYAGFGFVEVGRRPRYYSSGAAALVLRAEITAFAAPIASRHADQ